MSETKPRKTPLFMAIGTTLRTEIGEGRYAPGDRLPTEAELSGRFGVNRHTIRRAISQLVDEGLVHTRRGSGAFVTGRPIDYPLGRRVRFRQSLRAAGHMPDTEILGIETTPATEDEARRLDVPIGALIATSRVIIFGDGSPIGLGESRFPEHRLPGLAEALRREDGVTNALAALGVEDYTRASTRLSARAATATQALHLQIREGAPLLFSSSINVDKSGTPVEFGQTWFVGERLTLTIEPEDT